MVIEMSYELISGELMAEASVPDLQRFCIAAKSVLEIARIREDAVMHCGLIDVFLNKGESERLAFDPEEVSIDNDISMPRHVWLVKEVEHQTSSAVADAIEFDMQLFPVLGKSVEVLRGIVRMQSRLARGDTRPVMRLMSRAITWHSWYPEQHINLMYAPKGSSEQYFSQGIHGDTQLGIGELNDWLQKFNDYVDA